MEVCVVRPDWRTDMACRWGAAQLEIKTLTWAKNQYETQDLYGPNAVKKNIFQVIPGTKWNSFLGHGDPRTYTANWKDTVFKVGNNETQELCARLQNTGINFLSCDVGKELVPWMVENGLRAGLAYTGPFVFVLDRGRFPNSVAHPFFDAYCTADLEVFSKKSVDEAWKLRLERWKYWIGKSPESIRRYLIQDYDIDEEFGDIKFKPFADTPTPPPPVTRTKFTGRRTSDLWPWLIDGTVTLEGRLEEITE